MIYNDLCTIFLLAMMIRVASRHLATENENSLLTNCDDT
jgi:hypothetical protein